MNWVRHMYVVITGEILPRNTIGCEELSVRHNEYRIEIKSREPQKDNFVKTGRKMIQVGNALSQEISMKIDDLEHGFAQLYDVWHRRQQVYEENHDVQTWLSNAEFLENWLAEREQYLTEDWYTVESVENVEDLIRHFDDFLATLNAQSAHFEVSVMKTRYKFWRIKKFIRFPYFLKLIYKFYNKNAFAVQNYNFKFIPYVLTRMYRDTSPPIPQIYGARGKRRRNSGVPSDTTKIRLFLRLPLFQKLRGALTIYLFRP